MNRRKFWLKIKDLGGGIIIGIALALAMGLTLSRLVTQRPEYAALFIALAGFVFTMWWDSYKDSKNENQAKIALLSSLKLELTQTKNAIKLTIDAVDKVGERGFMPLLLYNQAWQAAVASPHFLSLKQSLQNEIIVIYGRADEANRWADIVRELDYSHSAHEFYTAEASARARAEHITIIRQLDKQIDTAVPQINNLLEKNKKYHRAT